MFLEKHTKEEDPETDEYVQHSPAASGERGRGGRAASGGELGFDAERGLVEALLVHHAGLVQQVLGDLREGGRGRGGGGKGLPNP